MEPAESVLGSPAEERTQGTASQEGPLREATVQESVAQGALGQGPPEQGDLRVVDIERVGARGMGIAHCSAGAESEVPAGPAPADADPGAKGAAHRGVVLLIPRGLPGERVRVRVTRRQRRHLEGRVEAVLRRSDRRVEPPCAHFAACGGCSWQHWHAAAQQEGRQAVLIEQLERVGGLREHPPLQWHGSATEWRYRRRLRFQVRRDPLDGHWRPAFYGLDGQTLLPIRDCHLAPAALSQAAAALLEVLEAAWDEVPPPECTPRRLSIEAAEDARGKPALGVALELRRGWPAAKRLALRNALAEAVSTNPALAALDSVVLNCANESPRRMLLFGKGRLHQRVGGRRYASPVGSFFQVHEALTPRLIEIVQALATKTLAANASPAKVSSVKAAPAKVSPVKAPASVPQQDGGEAALPLALDLFCGVGLFSLPLAALGFQVLGIDADAQAIAAARATVREARAGVEGVPRGSSEQEPLRPARLGPVHFKQAHLGQRVRRASLGSSVERRLWLRPGQRPLLVMMDPPREGLARPLIEDLLALGAPFLLYLSCDGATFARDVARLEGYRLEAWHGFDLFPQTHHAEVLGWLRKR